MNLAAINHRTSENYCYALNNDELIINIKTGYDVKKVVLIYGDPYLYDQKGVWKCQQIELVYKKDLDFHIWWTTTIKPEFKRCKYYFEITFDNDEIRYYLENGFLTKKQNENEKLRKQLFTFPWLNEIDVSKTPSWVNQTIWYQIFIDRFNKVDNKNENIKPWQSGIVTNKEIYGGNLQGIIDKLDYLKNLGVNGLYLTPVFEADAIHKYDTIDYLKVDCLFGDNQKLKELVEVCHQKGIKVMLDAVFNHTSTKFFAWQDILANGKKSKYFDWYMINEFPFDEKRRNKAADNIYYVFGFIDSMPKLNTNNKEVVAYLLKVVNYWIEKFNIDGIRFDVANEISHYLCKEIRKVSKKANEDIYLLGEIWHDSINWLNGDEFDSVMNYPLTDAISNFWIDKKMDKEHFKRQINHCYTLYKKQTNDVLFNLLDSHDTERLINRVNFDYDAFYQQIVLLMAMPGSPCIYYGTEIALEGKKDPDCRRCMPWQEVDNGQYEKQIDLIKEIIKLRKENECMRSQNFCFENEYANDRVIELLKIDDDGNQIKIIINASSQSISINPVHILLNYKYYENKLKKGGILIYLV